MSTIQLLSTKARKVGISLKNPISSGEIEALESNAGIQLPNDYREFLLNVSNGGLPPCRLLPLDRWAGSYWIDASSPSMISLPCIVTPDAERYGEEWLDQAAPVNWSERWDNS